MPELSSPYFLLIAAGIIIVLSYFYNIISQKTNIPSVLMLIATGVAIKMLLDGADLESLNLMPILELLGIVGLIMIVLEAALDLNLNKQKLPLIGKSMLLGVAGVVLTGTAGVFIIKQFTNADWYQSVFYAIPPAVISSAIVIPSVGSLKENQREFLIYESTFSDIFGIMVFYFFEGFVQADQTSTMLISFGWTTIVTIVLSFILSYILVWAFQKIESGAKLFLLISVLVLLYSLGKIMHLSSLLIILTFGLVFNNRKLFFQGKLSKFIKPVAVRRILVDFRLITIETAFVVRTFFFIVFGMTIVLSQLVSLKVFLISMLLIAATFVIRYALLYFIDRTALKTELWIAPRGLITILLFFAIPAEYHIDDFEPGILLYIILGTGVLMSYSLIKTKQKDIYDNLLGDELDDIEEKEDTSF